MIWIRNLLALAIGVVGGALLLLSGLPSAALLWVSVVFAAFLCYQSFFAQRLQSWLSDADSLAVPTGQGYWGEIFDGISRFVRGEASVRSDLTADIERTRALVERIPNGLALLDENNVLLWHNQAAQDLHGIFTAGRPIQQFIRQPEFTRYLDSQEFDVPLRTELASRPGRTYEIRMYELEDGNRVLISRDVTEQAKLDKMRDEFVANVSHEIRTPVTVIGGFAETLLDLDLEKPKQTEYLQAILKNSQTMQSLVADLLTLSSLEAEIDEVQDESILVNDLFDVLAADTRDLSKNRHTIQVHAPDAPISVLGRRTEIESAVRNLLSNAVRYTPDGGSITLSWTDQEQEGCINVIDTGIGIGPEHHPQLTQRFYRVDRARSRSTGGTGLGLAIVKRITTRHSATLKIQSKPGEGSTFTLVIPASRIKRS
jgi:two-component system phosphate regulon sensor histidine kinase PhoR